LSTIAVSSPRRIGDEDVLATLAGLMDQFDPNFNIVTP
jgi:alkyl sulfatase BDS1-like metallo-beta-lactamase superfamily hydrolase